MDKHQVLMGDLVGLTIGIYNNMAIIIDRVDEKVMSLNEEEMTRTLSIGSDWKWIRIGYIGEIYSSSASDDMLPSVNLAFGLTSGTASVFNGPNYFVGYKTNPSANWIKTNTYFYQSTPSTSTTRLELISGSDVLDSTSYLTNLISVYSTESIKRRSLYMVDFVKSSMDPGVWIINTYFRSSAVTAGNADYLIDNLFYSMSIETASISGYTRTSNTFPISESTYGQFDTVNFSWLGTSSYEITAVAVYRFL